MLSTIRLSCGIDLSVGLFMSNNNCTVPVLALTSLSCELIPPEVSPFPDLDEVAANILVFLSVHYSACHFLYAERRHFTIFYKSVYHMTTHHFYFKIVQICFADTAIFWTLYILH